MRYVGDGVFQVSSTCNETCPTIHRQQGTEDPKAVTASRKRAIDCLNGLVADCKFRIGQLKERPRGESF